MAISVDSNQVGTTDLRPARDAELVHEARKAIKRMRALARLLRYRLGERELQRVNDSLRTAAQRLAGARDAQVRLATLEGLCRRYPKALAHEQIGRLRGQLERECERASEPAPREDVLRDIGNMRRELARWSSVEGDLEGDFETIAPGLARIYREGRRRYTRVRDARAPDAEAFHDWRKRVKSLYYALEMLGGRRAPGVRRLIRRADRLGKLLGEEHDLWLLRQYVEGHPDALGLPDAGRPDASGRLDALGQPDAGQPDAGQPDASGRPDTLGNPDAGRPDASGRLDASEGSSRAREALLGVIAKRRRRVRSRALGIGARLYRRPTGDLIAEVGRALR
jgi:CHAD domain-containing protein